MTTINDTHLAYLLSLGFDIDLCKQALTQNSSLESATDWILNPSQPPTLNLGIDLSKPYSSTSQYAPTQTTEHDPVKEKQNEEFKLQQKKKFERIANELRKDRIMEKEARQRALLDIKEDQEKRKARGAGHSTGTSSQNTSNQGTNQNLTERQRVQLAIKKEKQLDREQRQRILESIRNDHKDKKSNVTTPTIAEPTKPNRTSPTSSGSNEAFIQFKLSNGSSLREKFPASTKVNELFTLVLGKEQEIRQDITVRDISLVCGFPRRTFTLEDVNLDMKEAGFLPNVSLNVVVVKPVVAMEETEVDQSDENMDEAENTQDVSESSMDTDDSEDMRESDEEELPGFMISGPTMNRRRQRAHGPVTSGGHQLTDPSPAEEENTINVPEDIGEEMIDRRANMLSAIESRNQPATVAVNNKQNRVTKKRYTKTLKDTCSVSVASLLSQHTINANRYLKKLMFVSSDVAESLIAYLIKSGQLNVSTLRRLADYCYLQNIVFDSYTYCTDSLIEDLCRSNSAVSIIKLSLRGCDVITDGAIRAIEGLKHLNYLDLNNCKVTDKGLKSLERLQHLYYLNLSKTKISKSGLVSFVANAKCKSELQVLILDGCTRVDSSDILIPIVNEFTNLVQLSYAYTTASNSVQKPAVKSTLSNKKVRLEQLDINHTPTNDNDLINAISQFKNLAELRLGGCDNITTRGLSFLPRELKNLKHIQFPNREHELDGVLLRYKDLPLENLDLSGFLNLTDEGAKSIAAMKHLRFLSLDGTKVTDEGIMLFKDLIELEKLSLDRTSVTDLGLEKLTGLSKLETLSLCRTGVTNNGVRLLGDFEQTSFARNLRTLNLAQCRLISDKGVRGLSGMANLTNLNLDHTNVSKSCVKYLKDLQHLNPVRLQGIEKEEEDDMIDSD